MLTSVVTRCVFRSQFDHKCDVEPRWGVYSAPRSPSWTKGKGKEGKGERRREGMKEKRRKGRRGKGTLCPSINS